MGCTDALHFALQRMHAVQTPNHANLPAATAVITRMVDNLKAAEVLSKEKTAINQLKTPHRASTSRFLRKRPVTSPARASLSRRFHLFETILNEALFDLQLCDSKTRINKYTIEKAVPRIVQHQVIEEILQQY